MEISKKSQGYIELCVSGMLCLILCIYIKSVNNAYESLRFPGAGYMNFEASMMLISIGIGLGGITILLLVDSIENLRKKQEQSCDKSGDKIVRGCNVVVTELLYILETFYGVDYFSKFDNEGNPASPDKTIKR